MPKAKKANKGQNKETTNADTAGAPDKAAEKAAKTAKKEAAVFKATGTEPNTKLAPQAKGILNILTEAGAEGLSRKDLVTAMEGVVESRQPLGRILSYYQKTLVESGAVEIVEAE